MFNPDHIKKNFTIFRHYPDLIFADNASTTHKPESVVNAIVNSYNKYNANVHRAVYDLGIHADETFANTKKNILSHYELENGKYEVLFTSGTTDGINKLARGIEASIHPGDNIIVSEMEHHSNFLPWQELCKRRNAHLRIVPITDCGELDLLVLAQMVDENTKAVSIVHISNTLGTINDILQISKIVKKSSALLFIDAAQSAAFHGSEFAKTEADAIIFSGHKIFGPSGIGILLGKSKFLDGLDPDNFGGGMVLEVEKETSVYKTGISKHEAGTPPLAQIAGMFATYEYLKGIDSLAAKNHISKCSSLLRNELQALGIGCLGNPKNTSGIVSVDFGNIHPHDAATFLNSKNIAVRAGHHCTQLIMKKYDIHASVRFSFTIYNLEEEIELIILAVKEMRKYFL